jgi:triosephosphate isomerase
VLETVRKSLHGSKVALGAQDTHFEGMGAHTGDISPIMLKDIGCKYVIVGHSERRTDHYESNELVRKKAQAAHAAGLIAIICVGETLQERENNKTIEVCREEIANSVPKEANGKNTVIAYEPIWAIGTGKTPTAEDVQKVHSEIRIALAEKLGADIASNMKILYGGSVKPSNAEELLGLPDVDGALIGGASLKADDFIQIARCASKVTKKG